MFCLCREKTGNDKNQSGAMRHLADRPNLFFIADFFSNEKGSCLLCGL
jgi:hypothetical protein